MPMRPSRAPSKSNARARTFSTSAANPRAPARKAFPRREEMRRILPVLEKLRGRLKIPISVDTSKAEVAEAAAYQGAEILNDVTSLRADPRLAEVARKHKLPLILMHMRGEPRTMQKKPFARNVLRDVIAGLRHAVATARRAGVAKSQIVLDPGIGFGKSAAQNFELLQKLPELARLGFPLLVGASRKGFIGKALGGAPEGERAWGTAATVAASILGGAHIVRVHDVAEMSQVARIIDAVLRPASIAAGEARRVRPERNERRILARNVARRARQFAQRTARRLSRLDARRLRFLHPHLRPHASRGRVPQIRGGNDADDHRQPRDAPRRCNSLWLDGGPLRPPHSADDRRHLLFGRGSAFRFRAQLSRVSDSAASLRHRHGRRMGRGRVARDGICSGKVARNFIRCAAGGLRARQFARGRRVLD